MKTEEFTNDASDLLLEELLDPTILNGAILGNIERKRYRILMIQ